MCLECTRMVVCKFYIHRAHCSKVVYYEDILGFKVDTIHRGLISDEGSVSTLLLGSFFCGIPSLP